MSMPSAAQPKVTRADIEAKFRQIQGDVETGVDSGRDIGKVGLIVGVVVAIGVVYILGRRHGRKKRTIVEIKRV
ncbi:MAG: hypothetical protein FJW95_10770 [Actinobacteria bacterium]|nr:hypothetical protein [Actinomycetota bacterium]